jgi:hypothetical protein
VPPLRWMIGAGVLAGLSVVPLLAGRPQGTLRVTFAEHIAPIVFANCTTCHRPGEAAPFSLMTYEDVARRGRLIAAVTKAKFMPPWKAAPGSYPFRDERRLTPDELSLIQSWVEQGMPKGDLGKLPPLPTFSAGWQLGEPDLVLEMPTGFRVPADGPDIYRNFALPLGLTEDKWIRAIELRPSARTSVHHALYFADATGAARSADAADSEPGYSGMRRGGLRSVALGGWAVGQQPHFYPDGLAVRLPKGSDLVLQYHFHPTGKAELERSTIGVYFADRPPARTLTAIQLPVLFGFFAGISIPAGDHDFRAHDSFVLPVDVEGVAIGAHAHYLGREMKMTATLPDGSEKTLLWIQDWDFAWQDRYFFKQMVPLPKGTRIGVELRWDNSADNPRNPSRPPVHVEWGEQSTDEMGSVTLQVVPRSESDLQTLQRAYRRHLAGAALRKGW